MALSNTADSGLAVVATDVDPDLEILQQVAAGDVAAFTRFVERHQRRLLRLCERLLGDVEGGRDAAQDIFLKVYRKAGSFRPRGRVSTWLYRIAVNHCLNKLRRRKVVRMIPFSHMGRNEGEESATWDPPQEGADPESALVAREHWQRTQQALAALPESQRAVVVLARFEGLSYRQIAEVMGITLGAVESRLFRAMRNLEKVQEADSGAAGERRKS